MSNYPNFTFSRENICDTHVISKWKPDKICHLASMAGVRYSLEEPEYYVDVNVSGFIHIMEEARKNDWQHTSFR